MSTLTSSSAWLASAVTTTRDAVDPTHVVRRAVLAEVDGLDGVTARQRDQAQGLLRPDVLPVVVGDEHPPAIRRHRRFVRRGHHRNISVGFHRLQIDQGHRVGLLIDGDDGSGQIHASARRLGG